MSFEIVSILPKISQLYKLPNTKERFDKYLYMLQGGKKQDLVLPIAGFNPMGNKLVVDKLEQLVNLNAEDIAQHELFKINKTFTIKDDQTIQVGINLVDDIGGAWSNYYTTDYTSKFEINSLLKRNFCAPYFWTSETISEAIIQRRIHEYVYRTLFWILNGKPETVKELMEQEVFVSTHANLQLNDFQNDIKYDDATYEGFEIFYKIHKDSTEYSLKFNLFYGDKASEELNYTCYGVNEINGFDYARFLSLKSN